MAFNYDITEELLLKIANQAADIVTNRISTVINADDITTNAANIVINTLGISDNTDLILTKTTGDNPSIDNSLARFVGTDGKTIQSSDIVVDDMANVGIGTTTPEYKVDIRTPGSANPKIHVTGTDEDAGGYIGSAGGSSIAVQGGSTTDDTITTAKSSEAGILGTVFGITSVFGNAGLVPGTTYTPTELFRVAYGDAFAATAAPTISTFPTYARLDLPVVGVGPPTFTTRSDGAKIVLYPLTSASTADLAIGVENSTMWFGHLNNAATSLFKWYGGTTEAMRLQGDGRLFVKTGGSTVFSAVGGTRFDYYTDANNSGTTETDLYSSTTSAGALANNGDKFTATYQIVCNGAALSSQQMKIYFGGTVIYDSGALAIGAITSNFTFDVTIIRVSATVVRCSVSVSSDFATLFPYSKYTEVTGLTLANAQILKITGTAAGAAGASSQITAKLGTISWQGAAI